MESQEKSTEEKKSKTGIVAIVAAIIIIALVGVIVFLVLNKPIAEPEEKEVIQETNDGRGVVVTPENINEVLSEDKTPEGFFETCMTNDWTFNDGVSSKDDVYVKNADTNNYSIYFDLKLNDGDKLVYSSPYIPVGVELPQFTLTDIPEKGDYDATVVYHLVDENNKEVSDVSIAVTLHIK